jgi:hypothetical protein
MRIQPSDTTRLVEERSIELSLVRRVDQGLEFRSWLHSERDQVSAEHDRFRRAVRDCEPMRLRHQLVDPRVNLA